MGSFAIMSITNDDIRSDWEPGDTLVVTMDGDGDGTDAAPATDGDGSDGDGDGTDGEPASRRRHRR
jgi:hypothetical protein